MNKLLFATDVVPFPLDRGQRVRMTNLVRAAAQVFEVTLVAPAPESERDRQAARELCERVKWVKPLAKGETDAALLARAALAAPGVRRPRTVRWYLPFAAAIRDLDVGRFDFIWAERIHLARLFSRERARTIIDLDDVEHVKIRRRLRVTRPLPAMASDLYRFALYAWQEVCWSAGFLGTVVCSDEDRDYLLARGCKNVVTVANGVDLGAQDSAIAVPRKPGSLRMVFLGHLASEPNLDALAFFVRQVLPKIRAAEPAARFEVIGGGVTAELETRFGAEATFRGFVEDLRPALRESDVFVAPLRFGSGTKLKLLDAMSARVPIVTTPVGAEGLGIVDGEHALLATTPDEIASAVLKLNADPELAARLAASAHDLVHRRFSWDAIRTHTARWLTHLDRSCDRRGVPRNASL